MTPDAATLSDREDGLGAVLARWLESAQAGEAPDEEQWLALYPQYAGELRDFFASQLELRAVAAPLREAIGTASSTHLLSPTAVTATPEIAGHAAGGVFGDYVLGKEIGRGGMGVVYQARQISLNRDVALKVLRTDRADAGGMLRRFRHEAELIAHLDHPSVVPIYDVGEHDGQLFYAMKLIDGGSLAEWIQRRFTAENAEGIQGDKREVPARSSSFSAFSAFSAVNLLISVARAVHFAHQRGVLHRDLKPSNVLLDREGRPFVTDFGLGRRLETESDITQSGAIVGTPSYMAPEQTAGRGGPVTIATDVYGLGAILYALLTGRPPFRGETVLDTLMQVREHAVLAPSRINPRVDRDLETICLKCLHKEPARRYATAAELADDLARYLAGQPIAARPVSSLERLLKWVRRQPALAALAAVSILSVVVLIAGSMAYQARLRAAVERADTKAAEAQRQKERVEAGYQSAHDTLNRMLGRVESRHVSDVPQLKELQRGLLEDALAFYLGQLAGADDPDPAVRRDTALACRRAADIQHVMGRAEAAAANYQRALALLENLPAASRDSPENQAILGGCWNNLATLAGRAGRQEEVERYNRNALVIRERLAQSRPDDSEIQNGLAETLHNLGAMCSTSRSVEAESYYQRAVAIRAGLVRSNPRDERYQAALAEDYLNLGQLYQSTNRPDEASKAFEKADALLRPLADREPPAGRDTLSLIALYSNWGYLLAAANRPRDALARLDEAVRRADAAYCQEPGQYASRQRAVQAHVARAEVQEYFGNLAASVKDWDRAIEVEEEPARYDWRLVRARVLTGMADHVRATAEADELSKRPEARRDNLIYLARIYALAIAPARGDAKLDPRAREARAERYGSSGVAMLRKLQEDGYFKDAGHLQLLRSDKRLRALRERDDFQRLLKQVEGMKK